MSGPFNLLRYVNDLEGEHSFFELFLDDRYTFREGFSSPAIVWTLGDNTKGPVSPGNPQSPFLDHYRIESRSESGEVMARVTEERGLVTGVAHHELVEVGEVSRETSTGHFDGLVRSSEAKKSGETLLKVELKDDGSIHIENPSATLDVRADGHVHLTNPNWDVTIEEVGRLTITNCPATTNVTSAMLDAIARNTDRLCHPHCMTNRLLEHQIKFKNRNRPTDFRARLFSAITGKQ